VQYFFYDKIVSWIQTLTVVCKLDPTPEQVVGVEETLKAFANACNYLNKQISAKVTSKRTIQKLEYQNIRAFYGLSANLAVRACARVASNRKTAKASNRPVKAFVPTSANYDARIFAYRAKDNTVSLTLLGGREHIPLALGEYQAEKLEGREPTSAQLCKHRDGRYYIHIQLKDEAQNLIPYTQVLGVDLGRTDIAHTSEGMSWSGQSINKVRDQFTRVRASLQSKGTKSAKRCLKRLSGRERRFQTWVNHTISRQIMDRAKQLNAAVAIEDLTGIRKRTNTQPRNKTERRRSNSWAFYQLRQFLSYKGIKEGVPVLVQPPAYTSQTHYLCLRIGKRSGKRFFCEHCDKHEDADFNAANVIGLLGATVSLPESSFLSCLWAA